MAWQIIAMDINRANYDMGRPIIEKAGVAHKIDFREVLALPVLDEMVKNVSKIYGGELKSLGMAD